MRNPQVPLPDHWRARGPNHSSSPNPEDPYFLPTPQGPHFSLAPRQGQHRPSGASTLPARLAFLCLLPSFQPIRHSAMDLCRRYNSLFSLLLQRIQWSPFILRTKVKIHGLSLQAHLLSTLNATHRLRCHPIACPRGFCQAMSLSAIAPLPQPPLGPSAPSGLPESQHIWAPPPLSPKSISL